MISPALHHMAHVSPPHYQVQSVQREMSVGQFVTPDMVSSVLDRKDNTWLQLDVCPTWRETGRCPSQELCCHAHPPPHIEILERCSRLGQTLSSIVLTITRDCLDSFYTEFYTSTKSLTGIHD